MLNAMTIDVEDYFQVSAFERHIARADWEQIPCRIERNMDRILELLERHATRATFFTLGWIAERHPRVVRELVAAGHELACHGLAHVRVTQQTPASFREDVRRSKALLEDIGGVEVRGYRAASYSIDRDNQRWAHETLYDCGYRYSSSVYPVRHDLYGIPEAPRFAYRPLAGVEDFVEIPITTSTLFGRRLPSGGGGFFRLYPYAFSRQAIRRINRREGAAAIFYFHPWEIDPDQPRVGGIPPRTRVRHYLNLARTEARLERLLQDFHWGRMDQVFLEPQGVSVRR
ncbi:DUF3473 domain-containing protein [Marichromatium gracile]|uniref:XrtA system polysaccharide deacetylase n=1 Tax=Marichromatium gracile TaxID=1048 RepID=UPI001F371CF4|nr:XrtA system polysaccharide deacetylase [Marichromatium gracile]MCF1182004.1 DUF3473 domain-containing protein [Marichromatium gracile]